jgi:nucleotide-binding universal stress UspA family protein
VGDELAGRCLHVATGEFVTEVAKHAFELGAQLIVVPPRKRMGTVVTRLARAAALPVLVARTATAHQTIVAATDLRDGDYPVLRKAAELGARLRASVVAVHNVTPVSLFVNPESGWPVTLLRTAGAAAASELRLARVLSRLQLNAGSVLADAVNPVDAILREASARDADLVVVGTRPRSWFSHLAGGSVAAQVVDRACGSVLVSPLAGFAAAQPTARS